MDSTNSRGFLNYPDAKQGHDCLADLRVISFKWFSFLRTIVWFNAGFGGLRHIRKNIEDYEPRFDPTVVPPPNPLNAERENDLLLHTENLSVLKTPPTRYYSVADYHAMYMAGELTPIAVAKAILPLIRRDIKPPGEHSLAWFDTKVELVLAAAEASTLRYKTKCPLGLLDGIPTAVKDEYDIDGYRTCLGSVNDYTSEAPPGKSITSWCVRQLEDAGAIVLGKLSMHEFGLDTSGNNPIYGTPRNPYNNQYYTGGSSSGSAYAVSAGLIPVVIGTDGGGSIRIPSSFCCVYGLKPSHSRVSHRPGCNHSNTCAVNGPIAADIRSLAVLYHVIGTPHPSSHFPSFSHPLASPLRPRDKILGVPEAWFSRSTLAIQRLCRSFLDKLVSTHDYTLIPIEIPYLVEGQTAHAMTVLTDAATLLPNTENLTSANKIMIGLGATTPATDFLLAQKLRQLLMQHLAYLWKKYPGMIIVTPTTSCAGWPICSESELKHGVIDGDHTIKTMEYVWLANFTGIPALSVPVGFVVPEGAKGAGEVASEDTAGRIPVGLMGMGEWASEDHLLQWGLETEEIGEDRLARPPIWVDVVARAKEEMTRTGDTSVAGKSTD
ncbi:amidase [Emydomyces testavorans]|uniref:Amidase n=1 Tax=Emydomyces testavorans TaxID=2070801 RepID=A0AAF0II09_9EURO|nr:amidase [Emydomyces testavorans]